MHYLQILTQHRRNAVIASPEPNLALDLENLKRQKMCPDFEKKSAEKGAINQILWTFEDNFPTVFTLPVWVF